ncbi:unnamed protein product [Gongylonema pulchrum]|uniref:EGF-like domain-containing protein n=1 Tax=Gongylonema pulchrum TaxID=637853 RepID=A0A183E459_9BILA|nr:unnamed protein product [Gongylonema pulchrum]
MKSAQQLTEVHESSLPPSSLSSSSSQLALSSMWSEDACVVVLSHALSIAAPAPIRSHVTSLINAAYNCTDRCGTECENGGSVNANCKCVCGYGFEEKRIQCKEFEEQTLFVESPWMSRIFESPERREVLTVWQGKSPQRFSWIPCTTRDSLIGMRFESDSDWLLIELRTNPWSERPHRGPRIRYRLVDAPYQRSLRAFTAEVTSVGSIKSGYALTFVPLLLLAHLWYSHSD